MKLGRSDRPENAKTPLSFVSLPPPISSSYQLKLETVVVAFFKKRDGYIERHRGSTMRERNKK